MRSAMQGLTVVAFTLTAAAPLRAQAGDSLQSSPQATARSDSGYRHDAGHKHGGGKHGAGHKWLSFDAATNTVSFKLVAGRPRGTSRLNFNGYADGKATLVVPPKSTVVMHFKNEDSVPHSAAVVVDRNPMPETAGQPALPHAATKDLRQGLPRHGADVMRFTAPASGSYRIVSGVPGQGRSGMWIRFKVDPTAKAPAWLKSK
jgi:Sulfocyanin (SoxE) domain